MNDIPSGDNRGGAGCEDPHVRFCERPMIISWAYSIFFVFVPKPPTDSGTLANVAFLYKIGFTSEDIGQFN